MLYGASGVGKSSILHAGVVPHLQSAHRTSVVYFNRWQDAAFLTSLKVECVERVSEKQGRTVTVDINKPLPEFLAAIAKEFKCALLILLDQFEEYFLYHQGSEVESTFVAEFASAINGGDAELGFVIALRDDWLSRLDRFQAHIPNLLGNTYRLEHLSAAAAEDAIRKPLAVFAEKHPGVGPNSIEDELVRAVLGQVRAGEVSLSELTGQGKTKVTGKVDRIETAFLQLVMTRLWDEEVKANSRTLRFSTFERLGGAKKIVQSRLEDLLNTLPPDEQEMCANMFRFLVTPTGAKIAQLTPDLVLYAGRDPRHAASAKQATSLLQQLAHPGVRVLRHIDQPESYEIFHDVLAAAVLDWRAAYEKAKEKVELEKKAETERQVAQSFRRLAWALACIVVIAVGVALYAWHLKVVVQRSLDKLKTAQASELEAKAREATAERGKKEQEKLASIIKQTSEHEVRLSLSHVLAAAALNSLGHDVDVSVLFALKSIEVTRDTDGIILPDAADALRRAVKFEPTTLIRPGHFGAVTSIAFSLDGTRIATAALDDTIRVWNASSGEEFRNFSAQCERAPVLLFSADGKRIACAQPHGFNVWDVESGKQIASGSQWVCRSRAKTIREFVLSPDGMSVAFSCDTEETSISESASTKRVPGHGAAFSPDGRKLSTIAGKVVKIWDTNTGGELLTISDIEEIRQGTFSPDGTRLATAAGHTAKIWDVSSGSPLRTLGNSERLVCCVAFSPDGGRLAVGERGSENTVSLWDASSGLNIWTSDCHCPNVSSLSFTPEGRGLFVMSEDREKSLQRPDQAGSSSGGDEAEAQMWDTASGESLPHLHPRGVFAFSPDGRHVAIAAGNGIDVHDVKSNGVLLTLPGRDDKLYAAIFTPDRRRIATAGSDNTVRLWDVSSGRRLFTLFGPKNRIQSLAFSPDGKLLAASSHDSSVHVWDAATGHSLYRLYPVGNRGANAPALSVAFSPNSKELAAGSYAAGGMRDTAKLYEAESGAELHTLSPIGYSVWGIAFSPDGKRLATMGGGRMDVWVSTSGKVVSSSIAPQGIVSGLVFSGDGRHLAALSSGLFLWKSSRGWTQIAGNVGSSSESFGLAFSQDGKVLAGPGMNNTARLWAVDSGKETSSLYGHAKPLKAVAFSLDQRYLYAVDEDWTIDSQPTRIEDLIAEAQRRVSRLERKDRQLKAEDCQTYLHEEQCPSEVMNPSKQRHSTSTTSPRTPINEQLP